ncbi:MAG: T9SS type A sorting domain-containing protein [Cyclobacteriaceae bacterium]
MRQLILILLSFNCVYLSAQSLKRPCIFVTTEEKAAILEKIEKYDWAKSVHTELEKSVDSRVTSHQTNPSSTINGISDLAADDNLSESQASSLNKAHYTVLSRASHAGMLYYLTEEDKYAQYAADVIWYYFQELSTRTPENTAIGGNYFYDPRSTYPHLAASYDLVYNFLQKPETQVFDKTAGQYVTFDNNIAQKAMKNVAGNALLESKGTDTRYGKLVSNHPILTAPGTLAAIMCIDDDTERERLFDVFWNKGTKRQNSFTKTIMPMFGEQGIWPESTSYSFMSNIQRVINMVDRLKPELNVTDTYMNSLEGVFLFENLRNPDRTFVRFGDSKRFNDGTKNLYTFVLNIAKRRGYTDLQDRAETALAQYYNAKGERSTTFSSSPFEATSHLDLFWGEDLEEDSFEEFKYKPTVVIKHAGVVLQRNYTDVDNVENGLCGVIGGAHYVHSHCTGIAMELYGSNYQMAPSGGMPPTVPERKIPTHTNYFRLYAGNNTVIINGTSHGRQQGSWAGNAYLWQNTTQNIAAEPAHLEDPLSTNFSFATQLLEDEINNSEQMRTLSTIRTSPMTAYYFDMFRSKSLDEDMFHDYIYHNIGDETSIKNATDDTELVLNSTSRYQNDIGDPVQSPGWRMFENTKASSSTDDPINIRFHIKHNDRYMHMKTPGGTRYEYTQALGPASREAKNGYTNKKTQIVAIRKLGEAWQNPFINVFEPSDSDESTIVSVESLISKRKVIGAIVTSDIEGKEIKDYILNSDKSENIELDEHLIAFNGRFGIVRTEQRTDGTQDITLYIGEGNSISYGNLRISGGAENRNVRTFEAIEDATKVVLSAVPSPIEVVQVYPNPSKGIFQIQTTVPCRYKVFNLSGAMIASGEASSSFSLDLSKENSSIYMLQIESNGKIEVLRLVKH